MNTKAILLRHLVWALPCAAVIFLYAQVADHQYIDFDDFIYTYDNVHVSKGLSWSGIKWAFTNFYAANYHPLAWISHMLDFELFGLNSGAEALVNAGFHAANSILVALLAKRLFRSEKIAIVIGTLFAIHPKCVEAIAWISQRKTQLSTFFALISILLFLAYCRGQKKTRKWYYLGSLFLFTLSLFSKGMFVTMPLLLLILRIIDQENETKNDKDGTSNIAVLPVKPNKQFIDAILDLAPYGILTISFSIVTFLAQSHDGAVADLASLPFTHRLADVLAGYCFYLKHFFYPVGLSVFYPLKMWTLATVLFHGAILISFTLILYWGRQIFGLVPVLGWIFFLVTLLPVIGLVQVGDQSSADRYMYQPIIGLLIASVPLFSTAVRELKRIGSSLARLPNLALVAWITLACIISYRQVSYWQNTYILTRASINSIGDETVLLSMESTITVRARHYDEAIELCNRILKVDPTHHIALQNLAVSEFALGHVEKAIKVLNRQIALEPNSTSAYLNLAIMTQKNGQTDIAREALAKAHKLNLQGFAEQRLGQELERRLGLAGSK